MIVKVLAEYKCDASAILQNLQIPVAPCIKSALKYHYNISTGCQGDRSSSSSAVINFTLNADADNQE